MTLEETYSVWMAKHPLTGELERLLNKKFTIEYNFNSNHIEGNTLTYGQTELLLLFGRVTGGSEVKDYADMKASQVGVEMVKEAVQDKFMPMTQNFIRQLHKGILREDYRFEYASPEETPALMSDLVDWYNRAEQEGKLSPVELAALFHYRYIRIHPFEDGNGRIARLLVNYILARHGWPMIVIRNRNKSQYLEALHKSDMAVGIEPIKGARATKSQIAHFLQYFKNTVRNEIQCDIDIIDSFGKDTWWYDGERIKFRSESGSKVLSLMQANPYITYAEMAANIGINISALEKIIGRMKEKGYLERQAAEKSWYVFALSTNQIV